MPVSLKKNPLVIAVQRFFPLTTSLAEKIEITNKNVGRYTVFVNRKHTLAHVVCKGDDMYMRVPIKAKNLHREPNHVVEIYFTARLRQYLIGF